MLILLLNLSVDVPSVALSLARDTVLCAKRAQRKCFSQRHFSHIFAVAIAAMPLYLIDTLFHLDWMLGGMRLEQHRIDESDEEWMRIVVSHVECVHRKAAEQREHVVNFWSSIRETFACCCPPPETDEHDELLEVSVETNEHDELLEVSV